MGSRKQITFDLSQEALRQHYPRKETAQDPQFFKRAYFLIDGIIFDGSSPPGNENAVKRVPMNTLHSYRSGTFLFFCRPFATGGGSSSAGGVPEPAGHLRPQAGGEYESRLRYHRPCAVHPDRSLLWGKVRTAIQGLVLPVIGVDRFHPLLFLLQPCQLRLQLPHSLRNWPAGRKG